MDHFEPGQILVGAFVIEAIEQSAEIGRIEMALGCDFGQAAQFEVVILNELMTTLIGFKCCRTHGAGGNGCLCDAEQKMLEDGSADARSERSGPQTGLDQLVEEAADVLRMGSLQQGAGRGTGGIHQSASFPAGEIGEIFDERTIGIRANVVGNARAVGEDVAGRKAVRFALQDDGALPCRDEFDGEISKARALHVVIGAAMLGSAAHDSQSGGGAGGPGRDRNGRAWEICVEKNAGSGDLECLGVGRWFLI